MAAARTHRPGRTADQTSHWVGQARRPKAASDHGSLEPDVRRVRPLPKSSVLKLQSQVGNTAVSRLFDDSSRDQMVSEFAIQRWASLGEENYHSPPHTPEGVGVIAGVPPPGEGTVVTRTNPIMVGDARRGQQLPGESEWRSFIGSGGRSAAVGVYAFLRAAQLSDEQWLRHVRRYSAGNPAQSQLLRDVGVRFQSADRRIRRPTDDEKMALAKAIYLRGQSGISFDLHAFPGLAELVTQFMQAMQPRLIATMAEHNIRFGAESMEPVTRAASQRQISTMIGSATGSLNQAVATYARWHRLGQRVRAGSPGRIEADRRKVQAAREAEMAGQALRGIADEAAEIRREEIERYRAIIDVAFSAVPLAGRLLTRGLAGMSERLVREVSEAVLAKAIETAGTQRVRDGLANALAAPSVERRLQLIRTEVAWIIRNYELGDPAEQILVTGVNATLVGGGD